MYLRTNGHGSLSPRPSTTKIHSRRPNLTTAVKPQPKLARCCDHCQRHAPRLALYVDQPEGGSTDACRSCLLQLTAAETHATLVARFYGLFRRLCPRFNRAGGAGLGAVYA